MFPQPHFMLPEASKLPFERLRLCSLLGRLLQQLCVALLQLPQLLLCLLCGFLRCFSLGLQLLVGLTLLAQVILQLLLLGGAACRGKRMACTKRNSHPEAEAFSVATGM